MNCKIITKKEEDYCDDGNNIENQQAANDDAQLPWDHFVEQFGVKNIVPIAQPSPDVTAFINAASVGKVPSVYNSRGELVGFKRSHDRALAQ